MIKRFAALFLSSGLVLFSWGPRTYEAAAAETSAPLSNFGGELVPLISPIPAYAPNPEISNEPRVYSDALPGAASAIQTQTADTRRAATAAFKRRVLALGRQARRLSAPQGVGAQSAGLGRLFG